MIATEGVWFTSSCPTPRARKPHLHRPPSQCPEPDFLLGSPCAGELVHSQKTPWNDNPSSKNLFFQHSLFELDDQPKPIFTTEPNRKSESSAVGKTPGVKGPSCSPTSSQETSSKSSTCLFLHSSSSSVWATVFLKSVFSVGAGSHQVIFFKFRLTSNFPAAVLPPTSLLISD